MATSASIRTWLGADVLFQPGAGSPRERSLSDVGKTHVDAAIALSLGLRGVRHDGLTSWAVAESTDSEDVRRAHHGGEHLGAELP